MHGDATSSASVRSVVDACMAKHGRIDILVNNVGRSYVALVAYTSVGLLRVVVLRDAPLTCSASYCFCTNPSFSFPTHTSSDFESSGVADPIVLRYLQHSPYHDLRD